jgi:hypothetical protein
MFGRLCFSIVKLSRQRSYRVVHRVTYRVNMYMCNFGIHQWALTYDPTNVLRSPPFGYSFRPMKMEKLYIIGLAALPSRFI